MGRHYIAVAVASLLMMSAGAVHAQAAADPVQALVEQLADCPPGAKVPTNPDGTPADVACTRQWVKGKVVRQDIAMSFELGSAQLTSAARATLDRFAAGLLRVGSFRPFTIEGHTDRSGSRALNAGLSQARARSVVDYLASKGVDRSRLAARGYGFDRPLPGRSAADPANRRVEVVAR
jgi:OmpA-OmpF porin, OOP family